jgi:hypothetical protein
MKEKSTTITARQLPNGKVVEVLADGSTKPLQGETDWKKVKAMTDEEIALAAIADPDCPLMTDEDLQQFECTSDLTTSDRPISTFIQPHRKK